MNILITGAAGFIGSNFLHHTLEKNANNYSSIRILDALTYSGSKSNFAGLDSSDFEFVIGNICDQDVVERALKGIDLVIHFAAESHVDRSIDSARIFVETNVLGTESLLTSSLNQGVNTFVHISTDEVYGSITDGSWSEDFPLAPNSPYAASKASSDLVALAFYKTHGLDVRVTRCSNNYGPRQFPEKVIPLFITNILMKKKLPLYGDGKNVRDWLHVGDHCRAIELVVQKGKPGEVYNIGGGEELSNLELTKILLSELGVDESWIEHVPDRKGHDYRYSLNTAKIRRELGFQPEIDFKRGIQSTIDWYQKNPTWWMPLLDRAR